MKDRRNAGQGVGAGAALCGARVESCHDAAQSPDRAVAVRACPPGPSQKTHLLVTARHNSERCVEMTHAGIEKARVELLTSPQRV